MFLRISQAVLVCPKHAGANEAVSDRAASRTQEWAILAHDTLWPSPPQAGFSHIASRHSSLQYQVASQ